jgi:transposase-like protein
MSGNTGRRYSAKKKRQVCNWVIDWSHEKGRGGIAAAAQKFGMTPLTISSWLCNHPVGSREDVTAALRELADITDQLIKLEKNYLESIKDLKSRELVLRRITHGR